MSAFIGPSKFFLYLFSMDAFLTFLNTCPDILTVVNKVVCIYILDFVRTSKAIEKISLFTWNGFYV